MRRLDKVIYEVNGKDCFVKAKNNSFQIEKVIFSFVKYDTKTMKAINSGDFYLDFESCLHLVCDAERGILQKDIVNEKKRMQEENQQFAKPVRQYMGGSTKDKAQRNDGCPLARILTIEPGNRSPYILKYMEGAGNMDKNGKLITPSWWSDKNKKPDFTIIVPCSSEDMWKLLNMLKAHINGYITSCYLKGSYETEYKENANTANSSTALQSAYPTAARATTQNTPGQKPHTVYTPSTEQGNKEGDTSEERYIEASFKTKPSLIEGSAGLYICNIDVKGKDLQLYFTADKVKEYKEELLQVSKTKEKLILSYVIVKDEEKNAYTYFMSLKRK